MIRIAITEAAFAETLPFGSTMYEAKPSADSGRFVWLERRALDSFTPFRQPGEDFSDVIIRLAGIEAAKPGRKRGPRSSG